MVMRPSLLAASKNPDNGSNGSKFRSGYFQSLLSALFDLFGLLGSYLLLLGLLNLLFHLFAFRLFDFFSLIQSLFFNLVDLDRLPAGIVKIKTLHTRVCGYLTFDFLAVFEDGYIDLVALLHRC